MNTALWTVQSLLGVLFLLGGGMKLFAFDKYKERAESRSQGKGMGFSKKFLTFIGACEVLGGLGLILPRALQIMPILTPLAALGLAIIMFGATVFHFQRKDSLLPTLVLFLLLGFVTVGRIFN